jgi:hypothetical protein
MIVDCIGQYEGLSALEALRAAWGDAGLSLAERARVVSRLSMDSGLNVSQAAGVCGASPAEMMALQRLAMLDDDDLLSVSRAAPPATTWILFAEADSGAIRAGVRSLVSAAPGTPVLNVVYEAMQAELGPRIDERIAAIRGTTLEHLVKKATEYGKLSDWQRKFLKSIAKHRRVGQRLSEKQIAKLREVLVELVELGVIVRDSADNDQEQCFEVLQALQL